MDKGNFKKDSNSTGKRPRTAKAFDNRSEEDIFGNRKKETYGAAKSRFGGSDSRNKRTESSDRPQSTRGAGYGKDKPFAKKSDATAPRTFKSFGKRNDSDATEKRGSTERGRFSDMDRNSGRSFGEKRTGDKSFGNKTFGDKKPFEKRFGDKRNDESRGDSRYERPQGSYTDRRSTERRSDDRKSTSFGDKRNDDRRNDASRGESRFERPQGSYTDRRSTERRGDDRKNTSFGDKRNDDRRNDGREVRASSTGFRKFDKNESGKKSFERNSPNQKSSFKTFGRTKKDVAETPTYNEAKFISKLPPRVREKIEFKKEPKDTTIRLNKYISNAGLCSRREADEMIAAGMITVNGKVVTEMGYQVMPSDTIKYGKDVLSREKMVYLLLNKPKDYITTMDDPEERRTIMDLVKNACKERVYPVGRLDRNTTGLILMTNDGELTEKLTHPSNNIKKIYQVELDKPLIEEHFELLKTGIELEDGLIKVDNIGIVTADAEVVGVEIHSGKNRIVRRMFEHLGYEVVKLDRTTFAGLTKKDLPRGNWRFLTEKELIRLKYML